jgi:hypothetical protein
VIIERFGTRLSVSFTPGSERVEAVLRDAERQIAAQHARVAGMSTRVGGLINGNVRLVTAALVLILREGLASGRRFCEWGCGLGGAACAASALGFEAQGIDIDAGWVAHSQALADRHDLPARFRVQDYRAANDGTAAAPGATRQATWAAADIVHVYPWPTEAVFIETLFIGQAPDDALLLSSYGPGEVRIHRKAHLDGRGRYARRRGASQAQSIRLTWP